MAAAAANEVANTVPDDVLQVGSVIKIQHDNPAPKMVVPTAASTAPSAAPKPANQGQNVVVAQQQTAGNMRTEQDGDGVVLRWR